METDNTVTELLEAWTEEEAEALWESLFNPIRGDGKPDEAAQKQRSPPPLAPITTGPNKIPQKPPPEQPTSRPPKAGTRVERSTHVYERKWRALTGQPSPPPTRQVRPKIRPATWARAGKIAAITRETGDDSAASGVAKPTPLQKTKVRCNDRPTSSARKSSTGENSAPPGEKPPKKQRLAPPEDEAPTAPTPGTGAIAAADTRARPKVRSVVTLPPHARIRTTKAGTEDRGRKTATPETGKPPGNEVNRGQQAGTDSVPPKPTDRRDGKPPVLVPLPGGRTMEVPYYAAHVARRYRRYVEGTLWRMRFAAGGILRSLREG